MSQINYKRILVKLSGEALLGNQNSGIDPAMIDKLAAELVEMRAAGVEVACVVGGGEPDARRQLGVNGDRSGDR